MFWKKDPEVEVLLAQISISRSLSEIMDYYSERAQKQYSDGKVSKKDLIKAVRIALTNEAKFCYRVCVNEKHNPNIYSTQLAYGLSMGIFDKQQKIVLDSMLEPEQSIDEFLMVNLDKKIETKAIDSLLNYKKEKN